MENNDQPITNNKLSEPVVTQPTPPAPISGPAYVSGDQNYTPQQPLPPKTSSKKLWISIGLAGILLIAGAMFFFWVHRHDANVKKAQSNTATTTKVAAPLVTTATPAALKPGTYTVGSDKNIIPGLYSLSPGPQQNGNVTVISPAANYSVILNDNGTGVTDTKVAWAQLSSGDKVQISGGNLLAVNFRAVKMSASASPALAKLYDDSFTVTDTPNRTNPGKYFITDLSDKNAYILVVDKDYNIKYNEPLDSTGFHAILEDGDQIATINMTTYRMKPE